MEKENNIRRPKQATIGAEDIQETRQAQSSQVAQALPRARPKLAKTLRVINEMMTAGVIGRYAIGGAVGATFYLEPVTTMDVDIFVAMHAHTGGVIITPTPIYDYLTGRGYAAVGESIKVEDWLVQFLPPTGGLVEEAITQAREVLVGDDVQTYVFTAEHLIAIALQTGRPKDMARILQFIDAEKFDQDGLRQILQRHDLTPRWSDFKTRFRVE